MDKNNVRNLDRSMIKDIRDIVIDTSKPCVDRVKGYIEQMGDPYCYVDDGVVVQIGYADTQVSLHERLVSYASIIDRNTGNLR